MRDLWLSGSLGADEARDLLDAVDAELAVRSQIRLESCAGASREELSRLFERGCADALAGRAPSMDGLGFRAYRNGLCAARGLPLPRRSPPNCR